MKLKTNFKPKNYYNIFVGKNQKSHCPKVTFLKKGS